ncbi:O-antigen ligase family protein [Ruminococcus flavefaciens]|uniref:O-antigen ligase family protein n=1 Tax=Ruminococcus flavefaciens TaxID=1265 RepID=UPI00048B8BEE|nr:O-antigen ligase family protein [Ruminococcus flavefaciens]
MYAINKTSESANNMNAIGEKILLFILFIYFIIGKFKIFTVFGISMDYLFWIIISSFLIIEVLLQRWEKNNNRIIPAVLYLVYQYFELLNSDYRDKATVVFVFNVIAILVFTYFINKKRAYETFFSYLNKGGLFYSITIILQSIIPNIINNLRKIILSDADYLISQRGYENTTHYMAGLAPNVATAAFFISIMLSITISRLLLQKNMIKNSGITFIGLIALLLTQKRSFMIGIFFSTAITVLLFNKNLKKKIRVLLLTLISGSILIYILYLCLPAMTIFLERIFENDDVLSGREAYYDVMKNWISESMLLGKGIGTCNGTFGVGGHNCYLQLLSETGIIGCILFANLTVPCVIKAVKMLLIYWNDPSYYQKNIENVEYLLSSVISIVLILFYAFFGNPFYDFTFCLTFYVLLTIPTQLYEVNNGDKI